jgi:hypothetical protein
MSQRTTRAVSQCLENVGKLVAPGSWQQYKQAVWHHYRQTLIGTQVMIAAITVVVVLKTHRLAAAAAFLATMQIGALLGAMWAARLRARIERARAGLRA